VPEDPTDDLRVSPTVTIPGRELVWRFSRSGGAGGQHVNTTDSRVELSWDVVGSAALSATHRSRALAALGDDLVDGIVTVAASERRSQLRNREIARERLADLVRDAIAPPPAPRRPTKPSRAARQRRVDEKKRRGQTKELRRRPAD
jgi:ribosome-associated protein